MIKPIVTDIKILHRPCTLVTKEDNIKTIIQDLKDTLESKKGWGLTANQLFYNKAVSYIKVPTLFNKKTKKFDYKELVLINPKIIEKDRKTLVKNEACLSFPGIHITTDRWIFITVEYLNEKMEKCTSLFQDIMGIVIQHEIDHTQGRTIFERKHKNINKRG